MLSRIKDFDMKENYYIEAAIKLGIIDDTVGYGFENDNIILLDGELQPITNEISEKAEEIHNLNELRKVRDEMLSLTDWWVLADRTPNQAQIDYRQALRDITKTYSSLYEVVWPTKPENN